MSLKSQVEAEMKAAMKAKDKAALTALRGLKSMILLAETEAGAAEEGLSQAQEAALLNKAVKQRRDSYDTYQQSGREDLAEKEMAEIKVIEQFLPEQMDEAEIEAQLKEIVEATGATSMKDMGKVMGQAQKAFAGKADNSVVAAKVKALLSGA